MYNCPEHNPLRGRGPKTGLMDQQRPNLALRRPSKGPSDAARSGPLKLSHGTGKKKPNWGPFKQRFNLNANPTSAHLSID
jgi:hypothetical protein